MTRVVYSAATAEAFIELSADGLSNDVAEQVAVRLIGRSGLR
jgi:hypothetical protein